MIKDITEAFSSFSIVTEHNYSSVPKVCMEVNHRIIGVPCFIMRPGSPPPQVKAFGQIWNFRGNLSGSSATLFWADGDLSILKTRIERFEP